MKVFRLVLNDTYVLGFRFYFEKLNTAYDMTIQQFKAYYSRDRHTFHEEASENYYLDLIEVNNRYVTQEELDREYKVIELTEDSSVYNLLALYILDKNIDRDSVFRYNCRNSSYCQMSNDSTIVLDDIDLSFGKVIVHNRTNESYLVSINDLVLSK